MSATTCSPLEPVAGDISPELRAEIRHLVDAKYDVDALACHSPAGRRLTEPFHDGAYGPRIGTSFFRTVLPFSDLEPCGEAFSALVPTSQTIGASWRWTTDTVPKAERPALLSLLQDPVRATADDFERADFIWIKPLGLFLAHEGKNRVGFFRDMGAQWIPAHVAPYDYPAAERLAIYAVEHARQNVYWAVLDGQLLEPINHPDWALPVLRAYGVREHRQWPRSFPRIDVTAAAIAARLINPISSRPAPLDLQLVLEKDAYESEDIPCSLFDIDPVRIPWRFLAAMTCITLVALILVENLPPDWSNLRIASGIIAGIGMGGMLAPLFKLFRLPRRLVDPHAGLQKFALRERDAAGIR
ncbi:hypothetical protein L3V59_42005 (plasmid) [Burkholderia aenigmatica]|uniref:hypothetical protein n=1 Tax=Burkholderia aenigmatica TaxID=2015348 RepID=UPI001F3ECB07|nr:hypothetical protein [Burkholderia aenigmatica]UKD18052.1 hypothetical protein L3V59_42005 [Burkholderia aenigmatica]